MVTMAMFALAPLLGLTLAYGLAQERPPLRWVYFVALAMVALAPVLVRWPVVSTFGLYAFAATCFDAFPLLPGGSSLAKPMGALAGAVLLGAGLIERRLGRPPDAALWWGAFTLWGILSASWALDTELVLQALQTKISLIVLYIVAVCYRPSRRDLYWVCVLTVLGGVLAAGIGYFLGLDEMAPHRHAGRGRLTLNEMDSNPNTLGRVLLLPLALAIAGFVGGRGVTVRLAAVGCATFIGLGIFVSMSRSAVVAMATILMVLVYRMRMRWHLVAVVALLLVASMLAPDAFYERIDAMVSGKDDTGSGRLEIWRTAFQALERSGFLGAGLDNFPLLYKGFSPGKGTGSHNTYLTALLDLGVPGLLMMLVAVAVSVLAVWRFQRGGHRSFALHALEAACVATLVNCLFGDYLWTKGFWLAWTLLTWAMYSENEPAGTSRVPVPHG
jgi:O-antigen ligase